MKFASVVVVEIASDVVVNFRLAASIALVARTAAMIAKRLGPFGGADIASGKLKI